MPDLQWNKHSWDGSYDWQGHGEEWSKAWGSSEAQWFGSLYPRLHRFLPVERLLEIGPGYGRWTHYLLHYVKDQYYGIDLSMQCIDACRQRFADHPQTRFEHNDGVSLAAAPDGVFDLVFSFDSLVHAEIDVHQHYVPQILAKLTTHGVAFIHHSNWRDAPSSPNRHCRAESVSAQAYAHLVETHGGRVLVQERLIWGKKTTELVDAFTLFCRADSPRHSTTVIIDNPDFMREAEAIRHTHQPYCLQP